MPRPWLRLEHSLALLDGYLHPLLGARDSDSLKDVLGEVPEGYDADGRSYMATRIIALQRLLPAPRLAQADIELYDDNIKRHLDQINAARPANERIVLKYFQYLALFYTEHFLHRYFLDNANLLADLNALLPAWSAAKWGRSGPDRALPGVHPGDLTKLAYWMATGSGKTLLLHVNYLQFLHYHRQAGARPLDNILLITPNAGLSDQHLEEFAGAASPRSVSAAAAAPACSPTPCRCWRSPSSAARARARSPSTWIASRATTWSSSTRATGRERGRLDRPPRQAGRRRLHLRIQRHFRRGVQQGQPARDVSQRQSYGKAIIFDYSYRYFYGDGYGKEYDILNLPQGYEMRRTATCSCSPTCWHSTSRCAYTPRRALLAPVPHRAAASCPGRTLRAEGQDESQLNAEDKTSLADVLNMVRFLHRVTSNAGGWAVRLSARSSPAPPPSATSTAGTFSPASSPACAAGTAGLRHLRATCSAASSTRPHPARSSSPTCAMRPVRLGLAPARVALILASSTLAMTSPS